MQIDTLSEFLAQAGTEFRLYDLGRRLQPLSNDDFAAIEANQRPYPWPLQHHAWLAVCYWQSQGQAQPYVWFLKLPLDERGLFNNGAVKHFLAALVEQLGQDVSAELSDEQQQRLAQTPFTFQPSPDKLAAFHARLGLSLNLPASAFFNGVCEYLQDPKQQDWQQLGLQGIADLAARLHQNTELSQLLASQLLTLPTQVKDALLTQCEHQPLPEPLTHLLLNAINSELEHAAPNQERIAQLLRATAGSPKCAERQQKVASLLALNPSQPVMLSLAARLWQDLADETVLITYLAQLAELHSELFNGLFAELVSIPALRPLILGNLHNNDLPPHLKRALGSLFTGVR
ncbi:DUF3549 family protein [Oceanisphaera pacifica]|uniref:DUF3549 family protein n=1 Tax=Oceanisphaera pacifica TaxID=2818389 RepID=A0ABS3NJ29_9GAMM|nr:DUF3549 family protein [Oceanisphaera pacifica]MBO1520601.1 DUF3549 family protein [Oceanisphaera pacifica]